MSRKEFIKVLKNYQMAENDDENAIDLMTELDCAADGMLTSSECEDLANAFLSMND